MANYLNFTLSCKEALAHCSSPIMHLTPVVLLWAHHKPEAVLIIFVWPVFQLLYAYCCQCGIYFFSYRQASVWFTTVPRSQLVRQNSRRILTSTLVPNFLHISCGLYARKYGKLAVFTSKQAPWRSNSSQSRRAVYSCKRSLCACEQAGIFSSYTRHWNTYERWQLVVVTANITHAEIAKKEDREMGKW